MKMPPGRVAGGCAAAGGIALSRKAPVSIPRAPASVPQDFSYQVPANTLTVLRVAR